MSNKYKREQIKIVDDKIDYEIKKNHVFKSITSAGDDQAIIEMYKPSLFASSYARLKPFISSFQRKLMYDEVIKPAINKGCQIIRIMNDSILVDKRIEDWDNYKGHEKFGMSSIDTIGKMIFEKEYHNFKTLNLHKFEFIN